MGRMRNVLKNEEEPNTRECRVFRCTLLASIVTAGPRLCNNHFVDFRFENTNGFASVNAFDTLSFFPVCVCVRIRLLAVCILYILFLSCTLSDILTQQFSTTTCNTKGKKQQQKNEEEEVEEEEEAEKKLKLFQAIHTSFGVFVW